MTRPVFEFRPLPGFFRGEFRRFAEGKWLPDDGEYDLAFIGDASSDHGSSFPCCLYVQLSGHDNIACSWLSTHWSRDVVGHPGGNPWHRTMRDGSKDWGSFAADYYTSPNRRAGDAGMSKMSSERRCSNGRHVEFYAKDEHIAAGLLRDRATKEIFKWPENMTCSYCGQAAPATFKAEAS